MVQTINMSTTLSPLFKCLRKRKVRKYSIDICTFPRVSIKHLTSIVLLPFSISTGCSLKILFFLKMLWFFWTLPVQLQCWFFFTCLVCVHTLTPRENRERPESGIFLNLKKNTIFNEDPVHNQNSSRTNNDVFSLPWEASLSPSGSAASPESPGKN